MGKDAIRERVWDALKANPDAPQLPARRRALDEERIEEMPVLEWLRDR